MQHLFQFGSPQADPGPLQHDQRLPLQLEGPLAQPAARLRRFGLRLFCREGLRLDQGSLQAFAQLVHLVMFQPGMPQRVPHLAVGDQ